MDTALHDQSEFDMKAPLADNIGKTSSVLQL